MGKKYSFENKEIHEDLSKASHSFNEFSTNNDIEALKNAISFLKNAIEKSKESNIKLDYACCLRKYASTIIRDIENPDRYRDAQQFLDEAIKIFDLAIVNKDFSNSNFEIIQTEKQRALHQMRKCAYELKQGILLKTTVEKLLSMQNPSEMTNYYIDCHESLFHLAFANKSYKLAGHHLLKIKQACASAKDETRMLTWQRHLCKIRLAEIEQNEDSKSHEVLIKCFNRYETLFYETLEARIKVFKADNQLRYYKQLFKDFIFLFNLRVQKSLLGINGAKNKIDFNPKGYVLSLASSEEIFSKETICDLENILDKKISCMKRNGHLPLDYAYFSELNSLKITREQFDRIFSYSALQQLAAKRTMAEAKDSSSKSSPMDELSATSLQYEVEVPKLKLNPNANPFMSISAIPFMIFKPDATPFTPQSVQQDSIEEESSLTDVNCMWPTMFVRRY